MPTRRKGPPHPTLGASASRVYGIHLDEAQTASILKKCKSLGITLGNTTAVLCQIAHARILARYRHRLPPVEWEDRIRQPMHTIGPFSLRTRMPEDSAWRVGGGMEEFFVYVGYSICTLPRMPVRPSSGAGGGASSYEELMTRKTFIRRCESIKRQSDRWLRHPLLREMCVWRAMARKYAARRAARIRELGSNENFYEEEDDMPEWIRRREDFVFANEASSFGSVSLVSNPIPSPPLIIYPDGNSSPKRIPSPSPLLLLAIAIPNPIPNNPPPRIPSLHPRTLPTALPNNDGQLQQTLDRMLVGWEYVRGWDG